MTGFHNEHQALNAQMISTEFHAWLQRLFELQRLFPNADEDQLFGLVVTRFPHTFRELIQIVNEAEHIFKKIQLSNPDEAIDEIVQKLQVNANDTEARDLIKLLSFEDSTACNLIRQVFLELQDSQPNMEWLSLSAYQLATSHWRRLDVIHIVRDLVTKPIANYIGTLDPEEARIIFGRLHVINQDYPHTDRIAQALGIKIPDLKALADAT